MKHDRILIGSLLLACVASLILWRFVLVGEVDRPTAEKITAALKSLAANPASPARADSNSDDVQALAEIAEAYRAPIDFRGKVVDQSGEPVPEAKVNFTVADKYFKDGSAYEIVSDRRGWFSIERFKGAGLHVRVSKDGYYHSDGKSARAFGYGLPVGDTPPVGGEPAVFILQKMGETEPLLYSRGNVRLPRDGTPTEITLRREAPLAITEGRGDLRVEVWTDDANKNESRMYDWRCRLSVPGGGMIERVGEFNFQAPMEGYLAAFEHAMPREDPRWTNSLIKEFFLQMPDGCQARVRLYLAASGDHFVFLESYLNPTPGHRNLEFDPKKAYENVAMGR